MPKAKNTLTIKNLAKVTEDVLKEIEDRKLNPSLISDGDAGEVFIDGKPHKIIDNKYIPIDKANILLQKRKVVREYIKLQSMEKAKKHK